MPVAPAASAAVNTATATIDAAKRDCKPLIPRLAASTRRSCPICTAAGPGWPYSTRCPVTPEADGNRLTMPNVRLNAAYAATSRRTAQLRVRNTWRSRALPTGTDGRLVSTGIRGASSPGRLCARWWKPFGRVGAASPGRWAQHFHAPAGSCTTCRRCRAQCGSRGHRCPRTF